MRKYLQDVIIFLGNSIRFFALQMFINFVVLALLMGLTLIAFHLHLKYIQSFQIFLAMVLFSFLLTRWLQFILLHKKQFILQQAFITQRMNGRAVWHFEPPASGIKQYIKETKAGLKSLGAGIFSSHLAKKYAVVRLSLKNTVLPSAEQVKQARLWSTRSFAWQALIFFVMLLPFALVSFFLTLGIALQLRLVIFIIGLWFVWFLYMALVNPIFQLLMVAEIYHQFRADE